MKKSRFFAILTVFILLLTSGCTQSGSGNSITKTKVNLYFIEGNANKIGSEQQEVSYTDEKDLPELVLNQLLKGPTSSDLKPVIPKDTILLGCSFSGDDTIVANFSTEYLSSANVDEVMARYTIVQTLCELPGISNVIILVDGKNLEDTDGKQIGKLSKDDIVLDTSSTEKKSTTVKLYFSDEQAQYLVPEERSVITNDSDSIEKVVVNELLKGPQDTQNTVRTIPLGTKLLSVEVNDGTCFVNFSQEFISKHSGGSAGEEMTVYSIVNSLTEIPEVKKVVFLIEGQKVDVFISMIFNEPFARDPSLIQGSK